jgi:multiple sugar transport system permease protein
MSDLARVGPVSAAEARRRAARPHRLLAALSAPLAHGFLIALAVVMLYPVVWMLAASFRPEGETFLAGGLIPAHPTLENYVKGWRFIGSDTFTTFYANSFVICGLAIIGNLVSCSMAAYAFARLRFVGKPIWFAIMLGSIMLPIHAQLIPQYILFLKIGWVNTLLPLVVPKFLGTDAFFIFLMVQFMRTLPRELEQAAEIDGASFWQRYSRVVLPLTMPALVTTAVFTFIFVYNDYFSQLIYLTSNDAMTVPLALRLFIDSGGGRSNYGGMFAMSVLSIGPVLGFYIASQRMLVQGIATTGFK